MIVPGGGVSLDGSRWVSYRPGFFLPVRVLSRLFRRLFLERLLAAHDAGRLQFFGNHAPLADVRAFAAYLAPLRKIEWVVYAKRPFGGPEAVLASSQSRPFDPLHAMSGLPPASGPPHLVAVGLRSANSRPNGNLRNESREGARLIRDESHAVR
jgi:hypothetical protein